MRTILLALSIGSGLLNAQSWDALNALKPGDRIEVLAAGGKQYKGTFSALSPDSLSLETGNSQVAVERARVRRVKVRSGSRRVRNAVIGAAIGVAVGITADQSLGAYLRNETGETGTERALTYIVPIALFGGIGAALPASRTIYKSR